MSASRWARERAEPIALSVDLWPHDYKRLIDEHRVDLLVMNTKDEDQLAMHGLSYPLTVELRDTPLLLI